MRHVRYSIITLAVTALFHTSFLACAPNREAASETGVEIGPVGDLPPGWSEQNGAYVFEATDALKASAFADARGTVTMNELVRRKVMVRNLSSESLGTIPAVQDQSGSDVAICACEPGGTVYLGALPPGGCMVLVFKLKTDSPGEKESRLNYLGLVDFKLSGTVDPASSGFQFTPGSADVTDPTIGACGA